MSKLSIGLVTSPSEESDQLIELLQELGIEITYHISPVEIETAHIQAENLSVWLLNVNDDDWHDNIDQLLDESEASIYFNEPGNLSKQSHPQYWCKNLVSRLYELTGIDESKSEPIPEASNGPAADSLASDGSSAESASSQENTPSENIPQENNVEHQGDSLTSALDELETNSAGIPSEIAADLVSELETISPELEASIEESSALDVGLKKVHNETISPDSEAIEIIDIVEPEIVDSEPASKPEDKSLAEEDLAEMEQVNQAVEEVEIELENTELALDDDLLLDDTATQEESLEDAPTNATDTSLESSPDEQIDLLDDFDSVGLDDSDLDFDEFELENETQLQTNEPLLDDAESDVLVTSENASPEESVNHDELESEEIESETADISDEIMQLAETDNQAQPTDSNQSPSFEQIDLSAEVNPILESVRESSNQTANSVFGSQDDATQQQAEDSNNAVQDSEQAIEFLSDFDSATNSTATSSEANEADIELSELNETETEIEFMLETDSESSQAQNTEPQIESELNTELEFASEGELELALSDAESQLDPELSAESETTFEAESESLEAEFTTGGLELESIDENSQEKITGRAVFIEEQEESEPAAPNNESETEEQFELPSDGGLTLESIGDDPQPTTGRAQFVIDEEVKETDIQLKQPASETDSQSPASVETNDSLEQNDSSQSQEITPDSQESVSSEVGQPEADNDEPHADLTMTDDATELSDGLIDLDHEVLDQEEPESFEIPMLDDAATGLDFEEPSQPVVKKTELCPCWVIGASLGGPAAVKRFLQSLPKDINASFIITQHIDENFLPVLADILTSSSQFEVKVANGSNAMTAGQIYLAPLNGKTIFLQDGSMLVDRSQKWSEPYSPCIDDVIESLSAVYKEKSGAIIFSGMGQDGLNGAKKMKALGGQIWAQSVDTCANPSMPDAVISEQLTDVVASPEMLAEQLAAHLAS